MFHLGFDRLAAVHRYMPFIIITKLLIALLTAILFVAITITIIIKLIVVTNSSTLSIISYALLSIIWLIHSLLWISTLYYKCWTHSYWLFATYLLATIGLIMIFVQRSIQFGIIGNALCAILFAIVLSQFIYVLVCAIEWRLMRIAAARNRLIDDVSLLCNDECASVLSRLFFGWTNSLIAKGYNCQLQHIDDLYELPPSLHISTVDDRFRDCTTKYRRHDRARSFNLASILLRTFGVEYGILGVLRLIADCLSFAGI